MFKSKINSAIALKELYDISLHIGRVKSLLIDDLTEDEDKEFTKVSCKLLSDIMLDIEYPIIRNHPSLRPVDLLGKKFAGATYKIVQHKFKY
jgi:hypothetical protein